MTMSENARKAFDKLKEKGVPVMEWGEREGYSRLTQFVLIHKSVDGGETFADIAKRRIKEAYVNGHWINPMGIRHDIHEILAEHNLAHDWQNSGQVEIYDAEQDGVTGWQHKGCDERERGQHDGKKDNKLPMSEPAFSAFRELASIGAPVEDWHDHINRDPEDLDSG